MAVADRRQRWPTARCPPARPARYPSTRSPARRGAARRAGAPRPGPRVRRPSRGGEHNERCRPHRGVTPAATMRRVAEKTSKKPTSRAKKGDQPALLSGGNPQIPKGEGDGPVQAYLAAMPGWKQEVGRRLDALVVRTVPGVHKAVKWNSPFYGNADDG